MPKLFLILAGCILLAGAAHSQIAPMPPPNIVTLDVTTMKAKTVLTGTIADFRENPENMEFWKVKMAVKETLKGNPDNPHLAYFFRNQSQMERWKRTAALLFFAAPGDRSGATIIDLTDKKLAVLTADLKVLRTADEVLAEARRMISQAKNDVAVSDIPVPISLVVGTPLDNRNSWTRKTDHLYADVPADARLEKLARTEIKSPDSSTRIHGIRALRFFPTKENIELLKPLLKDDTWATTSYDQKNKILCYEHNDVRQQCYDALRAMGVGVTKPEVLRPIAKDDQVVAVQLDEGKVTETDISDLPKYRRLDDLYLATAHLTRAQFAEIGKLKSVKGLYLQGSNISDSTLALLSRMANLEYLALGNTSVTDRGILQLAKFKRLRKVDLNHHVTMAGIAQLRKLRPEMVIRPDDFAFLWTLGPRRIEEPHGAMRNYLLPVGIAHFEAAGLQVYAFIFPARTAGQVDRLLKENLPKKGWEARKYPGYVHQGVPIILGQDMITYVDEVFTDPGQVDNWYGVHPKPGERVIVVSFNVDPRN